MMRIAPSTSKEIPERIMLSIRCRGADRPDGERGQIPTVWPPSMTMA